MRKRHSRQEVAGFTLIEIMVSMVLTGILVAGVVGLWGMVGEQFFRLSLRQKAVFVLHGQMERIAQLYRSGNMSASLVTTTNYPNHPHPTQNHFIFPSGNSLVAVLADFVAVDGKGAIFYWDQGNAGATVEDRNLVWLDDDKNVVAQLSWTLEPNPSDDDPVNASMCFNGPCQHLTLYMDYPYRFNNGAPTTTSNRDTISLKTIIGQWR